MRIVVAGAGQAAQALIEALRKGGHTGAITLVGEEPAAPYQRPPLSKKLLLGETSPERLAFRPLDWYAAQGVDLRLGRRVSAIDRAARTVALDDGDALAWDRLAIVTGARPRRLPAAIGGDLPGVHALRDLADVARLSPELAGGRRALVVGGGYIGLEAAAVCAGRGLAVTLVEAAPRILARVAGPETADYFRALHGAHGVRLLEAAALVRLEPGPDGRVAAAELASGERLACDLAIVGVGVTPNAEIAAACGLTVEDGVSVDDACRTSDPAIVAAGDVARFPYRGRRLRLESVQNAIDMGAAAAATLLAGEGPAPEYRPEPWFWSDQYDVKLQIAGLGDGATVRVVRPGARAGAQSVWSFGEGAEGRIRLLSVDAMNDPKAYMTAKRWLAEGRSPDPARIGDATLDLATLA